MSRLGAVLSFTLVLGVVFPSLAGAATQVCDQPDNTVLFCRPTANPCVISATFDIPGGCALDFGARDVSFQGDFNVDSAVLTLHAHKIQIDGRVAGRPASGRGGSLFLSSDTTIDVTSRGRIDVTGNSAGLMRLTAAGAVTFVNGAQINAKGSPSTASGGSIDIFAGGALVDDAAIDISSGTGGGGGALNMQAGTTVSVTQPIAASGGSGDGGDVDIAAADDASVTRPIDVSSISGGGGGSIRIRGGIDSIPGNQKPGGTLTVTANLTADGNSDSQGGYDGGDIALGAFGDLLFNGIAHATGGSPDGSAGTFAADSSDDVLNRITARDGTLRVQGSIVLRGSGVDSDGGDTDLDSGTDLFVDASIDATGGSTGGDTTFTSSRDTTINGSIASDASSDGGAGGSISVKSGNVAFGTLTVGATANFTSTGGNNGTGGDALLSGCNLSVAPNIVVDVSAQGARVDLAAVGTFNVGAGGRYSANPIGKVFLSHLPGVPPTIGAGVVFQTGRVDLESTTSGLYPVCPVCGDGIVEGPEVCDDGNTADGDCCNATCTAFTCATPTPTATPTRTRTPTPTKSATPTVTASVTPVIATETATATVTPTPTLTPTATGPTPSPTGPTPTATTTPVATVTATPTLSATPTPTVTGTSLAATRTITPTAIQTPVLPLIAAKVLIKCQSALGKATTRFVLTEESTLESCGLVAFGCIQGSPDGPKRTSCLANAQKRCASKFARIEAARSVFNKTFDQACGGAPPQVPFVLLDATEGLSFNDAATACRNDVGVALTSTAAIASCVQFGSACELERGVAIAAPRIADLLASFVDVGALGLCVPPPSGDLDGLVDPNLSKGAVRCEKTMLSAGRSLLQGQLTTASSCIDSLFKCRVSGKDCSRFATRCDTRLKELRTKALAKFTSSVSRSCGPLPPAAVLEAAGLGFQSADDRCAQLGVGAVVDANGAAACVARAYGCAGSAILRYALPMIDDELARAGLTLGNDFFCSASNPSATATPIVNATPTVTATPVVTSTPIVTATPEPTETAMPTATESPSDTPTATPEATPSPTETVTAMPTADVATPTFVTTPSATDTIAPPTPTATPLAPTPSATLVETPVPSPTSTAAAGTCGNGVVDPGEQCDFGDTDPGDGCDEHCQFETLIPGGGSRAQDCIAEWAVINPMNVPFLASGQVNTRQTCLDGDPSCDADAVVNDECRFRMAVCFTARDPNLPECTATAALTRYRLLEPLPSANDPSGTANAMALLSAIEALTGVAPTGNQFVFDPPFLAVPPDNCTEPFEVVVPLGGQLTQTEHFGTRTFSEAEPGKTATGDDSDDLRLVCKRP